MLKRLLLSILCLLVVVPALSYEKDTHLRLTYILARSAGINDEVSKYLAYGDQNIDQHFISTAMFFSAQRGLFHFTGTMMMPQDGGHGNQNGIKNVVDRIFKNKLALAERNHPVGSMLIYRGLVEGDLQLVAAGLHVKQDTYGHAGFTSAWGHMMDGHNPDRAFLETEKYEDMIRALFRSLVAIRDALPGEYVDLNGSLKFLNEYAKDSYLKRDMTVEDMSDVKTISGVFNSITDIKKIFFENIYTNYHYKKLALTLVYRSWSAQDIISPNITFEELFPDKLLRIPRMDTADTIKAVIVSDLESDFLKTAEKDIINTEKLFKARNLKTFLAKIDVEEGEFEVRLRELINKRERLDILKVKLWEDQGNQKIAEEIELIKDWIQKEASQLSLGSSLENLTAQLNAAYDEAINKHSLAMKESERVIFEKYHLKLKPLQDELAQISSLKDKSENQIKRFRDLVATQGEMSLDMEKELRAIKSNILVETYIKIRSRQLAEYKAASEIAERLTKDFIPQKLNQYVKHQFEGNTQNREFEVDHKDELYRRFIVEKFGSNWIAGENRSPIKMFEPFMAAFRKISNKFKVRAEQQMRNLVQEAVMESADEMIRDISPRDRAQTIKYNVKNNLLWILKMFRYAGPSFIPFWSSTHIKNVYAEAERFAKEHEVQDMKAEMEKGRYRKLVIKQKQAVKDQIKAYKALPLCPKIFRIGNLSL